MSADTLLGQQRAERFVCLAPRVLGVDEFALRRGRSYGTLLVDLERQQPVDVLPDTQADTLAVWLRRQPQIQVISRDRAGHFAEGATVGAPQAIQVADRWHLLRNLGEALQRLLARHPAALRAAAQAQTTTPATAGQPTGGPPEIVVEVSATAAASGAPAELPPLTHWEQRFREALARHAAGWSCRRIAQELGLHWRTVKRYVVAREPSKRGAPMLQATSTVIPYLAYLERRWQEGCQIGTQLWHEPRAQGYSSSLSSVYRTLKWWRPAAGRRQTPTATPPAKRYASSPRQGM